MAFFSCTFSARSRRRFGHRPPSNPPSLATTWILVLRTVVFCTVLVTVANCVGLVARLAIVRYSALVAKLPLLTYIVVFCLISITVPRHRRPLVIQGEGTRTVGPFTVGSLSRATVL